MDFLDREFIRFYQNFTKHYNDVIMSAIASHITNLTIVYSIVYSDADQRKHQSSMSLAFVRGIHRGPVNSPHKWPVTRKMFPFDDVIMWQFILLQMCSKCVQMCSSKYCKKWHLFSSTVIHKLFTIFRLVFFLPHFTRNEINADIFRCIFLIENLFLFNQNFTKWFS